MGGAGRANLDRASQILWNSDISRSSFGVGGASTHAMSSSVSVSMAITSGEVGSFCFGRIQAIIGRFCRTIPVLAQEVVDAVRGGILGASPLNSRLAFSCFRKQQGPS